MKAWKKTPVRGVVREIEIPARQMGKTASFEAGYNQACLEHSECIRGVWYLNGKTLSEVLKRGPVLRGEQ